MMEEFKPTGFSESMFKERYAFTNEEAWPLMCNRVAQQSAIAEVPSKVQKYQEKFYDILISNAFIPGGRILYNSGRPKPQLLNCFVMKEDLDSKEGWAKVSYDMILTSMTGGGVGTDFSDIRPRGADIAGQKGAAPGPIELMRLINGCGDPIRAGGSRRTALMFSLDLSHPSIEEFLSIKLKESELKLANISIRSKDTTAFIEAIHNDLDWELEWKGKYKRVVKARALWDIICKNSWQSAEPGFLNWELVASENPIYYCSELVTTNPCGEIPLEPYGACDLGHLVLTRFVKNGKIDWEFMGETIRTAVRFLDNILTVNSFPLPEMRTIADLHRRIGLGTTGYADMLVLLGLKYGSEEGNKFTDKLYKFIAKAAYESSVMLAVEKGPFPACKPDLHVKSGFVKRMSPKIKNLIKEHGIRNCTILTVAPTGTVSIVSGNCSSGIEPMMAPAYERNYFEKEVRKTELVLHPLFKEFLDKGKDTSHFVGSRELDVRAHLEVQKIVQRHVDSAVSKTINIPEDYSLKDMSDLWLEYMPYLKGVTWYRENSRFFYDKAGNKLPPPISKFYSAEEAEKLYRSEVDISDKTEEQSCKSGVCEL